MNNIEIEFEDVRRGIKIRVKGNQDEVEEYLKKQGFDTMIKDVAKKEIVNPESPKTFISGKPTDTIPELQTLKTDSLTNYVRSLIYSNWGIRGRTLTELLETARTHSITVPASTLSSILHSLNKQGKVTRNKKTPDEPWTYYPPLSVVASHGNSSVDMGATHLTKQAP